MSESSRLQRNKIFAQGLETTMTYVVRIGAYTFKFVIDFIREIFASLVGKK